MRIVSGMPCLFIHDKYMVFSVLQATALRGCVFWQGNSCLVSLRCRHSVHQHGCHLLDINQFKCG